MSKPRVIAAGNWRRVCRHPPRWPSSRWTAAGRTRQTGAGPGVHESQAKEDKIACLVSMRSEVHESDPQPQPPPSFRNARRVARLVQQFAAHAARPADEAADGEAVVEREETGDDERPEKPRRLVRTCVATMENSRAFGPMVAAEAQARAFDDAPRQAFLGDGQKYNWSVQRAWFPHFVPITDFLHVLCYLYRAAWAVESTTRRGGGSSRPDDGVLAGPGRDGAGGVGRLAGAAGPAAAGR